MDEFAGHLQAWSALKILTHFSTNSLKALLMPKKHPFFVKQKEQKKLKSAFEQCLKAIPFKLPELFKAIDDLVSHCEHHGVSMNSLSFGGHGYKVHQIVLISSYEVLHEEDLKMDRHAELTPHVGTILTYLFERGVDVNALSTGSVSICQIMAYHNDLQHFSTLRPFKPNLLIRDIYGESALSSAARRGFVDQMILFMDELHTQEHHQDPLIHSKLLFDAFYQFYVELMRQPPSHSQVNTDKITLLHHPYVQKHLDVNAIGDDGQTLLYQAILRQDLFMVSELLERGADMHRVNAHGISIFDSAKRLSSHSKVHHLIFQHLEGFDQAQKEHAILMQHIQENAISSRLALPKLPKEPSSSGLPEGQSLASSTGQPQPVQHGKRL